MNVHNTAHTMLVMASKDIKAMQAMIAPDTVDDEIFGFHAQQAVEKSLKAWIDLLGGDYGFTHDLERLFHELEQRGITVTPFEVLAELSAFAVQLRYCMMGSEDVPLDRNDILAKVVDLHEHVLSLLAMHTGPSQ